MGRKSREKAERKASPRHVPAVAAAHKRPLILWSYPGAGKSYFARWLVQHKSFDHIDTDDLNRRPARTTLEQVWWATVNLRGPADVFITAASAQSRPIVTEYGVFAMPQTVARLRELQRLGAMTWWLEADRDAALTAWKAENARLRRGFADELWFRVVSGIDAHWAQLRPLFGLNIVRVLEPGGNRLEPQQIYVSIFGGTGGQ